MTATLLSAADTLPNFVYHTHCRATRTPETMVINAISTYLSSICRAGAGRGITAQCIRQGETNNGEDVFDVERGRFGGVCVLLFFDSNLLFFVFIST